MHCLMAIALILGWNGGWNITSRVVNQFALEPHRHAEIFPDRQSDDYSRAICSPTDPPTAIWAASAACNALATESPELVFRESAATRPAKVATTWPGPHAPWLRDWEICTERNKRGCEYIIILLYYYYYLCEYAHMCSRCRCLRPRHPSAVRPQHSCRQCQYRRRRMCHGRWRGVDSWRTLSPFPSSQSCSTPYYGMRYTIIIIYSYILLFLYCSVLRHSPSYISSAQRPRV